MLSHQGAVMPSIRPPSPAGPPAPMQGAPANRLVRLPVELAQIIFSQVDNMATLSSLSRDLRALVQNPDFFRGACLQRGLCPPPAGRITQQNVASFIRAFPVALQGQRLLASIAQEAIQTAA